MILAACLLASPAAGETGFEDIERSKNFKLICRDASKCARAVAPEVAAAAPRLLELTKDARSWLQELDFPVERSRVTKRSGLQALVIEHKAPEARRRPQITRFWQDFGLGRSGARQMDDNSAQGFAPVTWDPTSARERIVCLSQPLRHFVSVDQWVVLGRSWRLGVFDVMG